MKKFFLLASSLLFVSGCSLTVNTQTQDTWSVTQISWSVSKAPITKTETVLTQCGFTINSPLANASVSFPLTIQGTVDNANASSLGCSWTMFEGEAGTAQLYFWEAGNNSRHVLNTPFIVKVTNRMTTGPVAASVVINFNNSWIWLSSWTPMKIVFTEENPSGGMQDTLTLPVTLQ